MMTFLPVTGLRAAGFRFPARAIGDPCGHDAFERVEVPGRPVQERVSVGFRLDVRLLDRDERLPVPIFEGDRLGEIDGPSPIAHEHRGPVSETARTVDLREHAPAPVGLTRSVGGSERERPHASDAQVNLALPQLPAGYLIGEDFRLSLRVDNRVEYDLGRRVDQPLELQLVRHLEPPLRFSMYASSR